MDNNNYVIVDVSSADGGVRAAPAAGGGREREWLGA